MYIINAVANFFRRCTGRGSPSGSAGEQTALLDQQNGGANPRESLTGEYNAFSESTGIFIVFGLHAAFYYLTATVGFRLLQGWPIVDSLYFGTVLFTTIGYGDVLPTTTNAKIFTLILSSYGIIILGIFLGQLGNAFVAARQEALESQRADHRSSIMTKLKKEDSASHLSTVEAEQQPQAPQEPAQPVRSAHSKLFNDIKEIVLLETPIVAVVLGLSIAIGHYEGWSITDSIYWGIITSMTIGLGDISPKTDAMRWVSLIFLPFAVAVFGEIVGRIANIYLDRINEQHEHDFLHRAMTLSDLESLDKDDDGEVSQAEFLTYFLVALQKCEKSDIDEIMELFDQLDVDKSGSLTKDDLAKMGKRFNKYAQDIHADRSRATGVTKPSAAAASTAPPSYKK